MKATVQPQANGQNEIYTYIAIPIEALQQCTEQGVQALTVAQNVILKALPDGNIGQQIQPTNESILVNSTFKSNKSATTNHVASNFNITLSQSQVTEKLNVIEDSTRPTVIEQNRNKPLSPAILRKSVILKSERNNVQNDTFNKPGIRYLKIKPAPSKGGITRSKDREIGSFKCKLCGQVLDKVMTYRRHMEMHRNMKKFRCEHCSASYNVEDNLKIHMAMHSKSEPTCPICDRKFQRLASLKAHIIIHEVEETYTCVDCLAEYEKEEDFNKHMEGHEKAGGNGKSPSVPLVCSICSHVFNDPNQYKEHISYHIKIKKLIMNGKKQKRRVHANREYAHKCDVCKKSFSKYCLLERHMRIHSGEKPFACHLCKRAFTQKGTLQIHLARHSGIKPFHCTLCPAKFCQKGNLRVHVQKTHVVPNPGEKVYKCTMCTCIFKRVSSLNAHITRAHAGDKRVDDITDILEQLKELEKQLVPRATEEKPEVEARVVRKEDPPASDVSGVTVKYVKLVDSSVEGTLRRYLVKSRKVGEHQWYICTFCSKEFKKPSDLIRHFRVHTREKPFKCKQCDQAFSLKSTLATHISTHIGKRQYQCIVCLKMFTSIRTLNTHLRRHDKNHSKRSQHYMCSTCNKVFNSVSKAKIHMEMHKSNSGQVLLNKGTAIEVVMQQPMVETADGLLPIAPPKSKGYISEPDTSKPRPHKCNYCSAAFTKAVHLKRHILIHSGERERRFKCDICTKSFYSSYALKEHLKFHSGERNFNCKSCGKRFVTNAILKRHLTIHSSFRPYVCPYCRKRFKTVLLCRKHINIHKRDLDMEIHALKETGELDGLEVTNGTATVTDLNDPLADNPFTGSLPDSEDNLGDLTLGNADNNGEIKKFVISDSSSAKAKFMHSKLLQQDKSNTVPKILFTDTENGIVISTPMNNHTEETGDLQDSLNQHLYQAATNPPEYVGRSTNVSLLPDNANILENVEDTITTLAQENIVDIADSGYPTVYINCDDLQSFTTANLYNACLAQLKNNDPLLLSGINEIQDPNLLFATDPTLNQLTDTQLDSQNLETLIPTFTFSTNLAALNNLSLSTNSLNTSFPNIILSNVEDNSDINQMSIFPGMSEVSKKSQANTNVAAANNDNSQKLQIESAVMDLNDDSITDINQEGAILSNLLYNANQLDVGLNVVSDTPKTAFDTIDCIDPSSDPMVSPNSIYSKMDFTCSNCKQTLRGLNGFKNHICDAKTVSKKNKRKRKFITSRKQDNVEKPVSDNHWNVNVLESSSIIEPNENVVIDPVPLENESEDIEHKCADCGKIVANKNALVRHLLTHKEKKSSQNICSYCSKAFKKRSDLERHIRTHTGEKPFSCDKCEKSFSLKSTLESHYRTHNPGGNKDFSCAVCSSYFSSKSSLRVHMLMHTGVKPYQCTMCPEKFRTSGHRKSHIANHLKKTEAKKGGQTRNAKVNSLLASVIMDSQNLEQNRSENISVVTDAQPSQGKQAPQLIVQESDKDVLYPNQTIQVDPIFLQQLQLNNVLLHNNVDDLPSFIQVDINNDGQITNVKPITTNVVTSINSFGDSQNFEAIDKNGAKSNVTVIRNFECDVCHKKYSSKSVLTKHKKIHAAKNLFNCAKHEVGFASEGDLDNHLKLHSGYRPFCCQLCANTFSQEKNLKTHMKRIHGTTT